MKGTALITIAIAALLAAAAFKIHNSKHMNSHIPPEVHAAYSEWKLKHGRLYATPSENDFRLKTFYKNYLFVNEENAKEAGYTLGLNRFADMSLEEFQAKYTGDISDEEFSKLEETPRISNGLAAPSSWDWVAQGALPPVTNQKSCGGCWAFASTASFEVAYWKKYRRSTKFSEQLLVDCDTKSSGCNGGGPSVDFLKSTGSVPLSMYPYVASQGTCKKFSSTQYTKATSSVYNQGLTQNSIKDAIYSGAGYISIYVDDKFRLYKGGVLQNRLSHTSTNHAVTAVGYGADYAKIRNSWDTTWGESGYVKMYLESSGMGTNNMYKRFAASVI